MAYKVSVMDFGSEKVSVFVGERGLNDTIRVSGVGTCKHSGFCDGKIFNEDKLPEVIGTAINSARESSGQKINSMYVGVPGDFCVSRCTTVNLSFKKPKKITPSDIRELYDSCDELQDTDSAEIINVTPVYFTLDNDRRLLDPVGAVSVSLSAVVSYTVADKRFTDYMRSILSNLGVSEVEFSSIALAQILTLFSEEKRDAGVVLIDVGFSNTVVTVARGDGIIDSKSFTMGGATISNDLAKAFQIPYKQGDKLKRQVNLCLDPEEDDCYYYEYQGIPRAHNAQKANGVVTQRIKVFARYIEKCLGKLQGEVPDYIPYSLTGGGLAYIRGAKAVLGDSLGKTVEIVAPDMPLADKPTLSSAWGLMNMAIEERFGKKSFLEKFINRN